MPVSGPTSDRRKVRRRAMAESGAERAVARAPSGGGSSSQARQRFGGSGG